MKSKFHERATTYRLSGDECQALKQETLASTLPAVDANALAESEDIVDYEEEALFDLACRIIEWPENASLYLERAKRYHENGEPASDEWDQAERDLAKAIQLGGNAAHLAESHAVRVTLRLFNQFDDRRLLIDDLKTAIENGIEDPQIYTELALFYSEDDDGHMCFERLDEIVSLLIAALYHDLWNARFCRCDKWCDDFSILRDLKVAYDKRADYRRERGKPAEAFEDDEVSRWIKASAYAELRDMHLHFDDVILPHRLSKDCTHI